MTLDIPNIKNYLSKDDMESKIHTGYLTLADISGYTSFMAQTELEHSQAILSDFLHVVIDHLTPTFNLAEVEGDAVFVHAPEQRFSRGETLLELIETTYYGFRKHRDVMVARTTCTCKACKAIPQLDLKFITHYGQYALQSVAGSSKPVGSDVNAAHRLLKNKVAANTGWQAYALFSDAAAIKVAALPSTVRTLSERYEHIGDIKTHSYDLNDSLARSSAKARFEINEHNADIHLFHDFQTFRQHLWQILNDPEKRGLWLEGTKWEKGERPNGRTETGSVNHCYHGKNFKEKTIEIIRDWKPMDYYTVEMTEKPLFFYITQRLEDVEGGTRLHTFIKVKNKLPRWLTKPLGRFIAYKGMKIENCWKKIEEIIANENSNV
jgi:hypothetical protein